MPRSRTDPELRAAVDTMFRIRAVESPPDPDGARTIWHRGAKGADLVTYVDAVGKVSRQELSLFDDHFSWERGGVLRTGTLSPTAIDRLAPSPYEVTFDQAGADSDRLQRGLRALSAYLGSDRYIQHMREVLQKGLQGKTLESEEPVTRSASRVMLDEAIRESDQRRQSVEVPSAAPGEPNSRAFIMAALGAFLAFVAAAVVYLTMGRG